MDVFDVPDGLALVASLLVLIAMLRITGPRAGDTDRLFRSPTDLGWPRGVQEEEPVRYRVELLGRNRTDRRPDAPTATGLEHAVGSRSDHDKPPVGEAGNAGLGRPACTT